MKLHSRFPFLLFAFDTYYPAGGWSDLYAAYPTLEAAVTAAHEHWSMADHFEVVNAETREVVRSWASYELNPCRTELGLDHDWSRWSKLKARDPDAISFVAGLVKQPTRKRICRRCGAHQDDGRYRGILPVVPPLRNVMPRATGTAS